MINHLYYEDIDIGCDFTTVTRTVTESDIMMFAGLTGDNFEIHTSEEFSKNSIFGTRVAHGLLILSIANGLYTRLGSFYNTGMALLGINGWKFLLPVKIGDTVHLKMTLEDKRETKKEDRGILFWKYDVINQHDKTVATGQVVRMIRRKDIN